MAFRIGRFPLLLAAVALLAGCNPPNVATPLSELGTTATLTLGAPAEPVASLAGTVQLAQAPPDGNAGILVYLAGTGFQARTDLDGTYQITGVPRGEYNVIAEKPGFQTLTLERITLDPERHTRQAPAGVRPAILERAGSELDSTTTGTAAGGLGFIEGNVYLQGADDADGIRIQVENTPHVTISDRDGSYRLVNVPPGRYTITFSHPGFRSFDTEAIVAPGGTVRLEDAALERAAGGAGGTPTASDQVPTTTLSREELTGTRSILGLVEIIGPEGTPVAEYDRITVALDNSDVVVTPDQEGKFQIPNLPPAIYKVTAAADGRPDTMQSQIADLTAQPTAQIAFRFGPAPGDQPGGGNGTVVGTVTLAPPPALPSATDKPQSQPGIGVSVGLSDTEQIVLTGADGRFTFQTVPAGTYSIILSKEGYKDKTVPGVEIAAGQIVDLGQVMMEPKLDRPQVVSTTPEQNARNVMFRETLPVIINFSKKMDRASVLKAIRVEPTVNYTPYLGNGSHPSADDDTLVLLFSNVGAQQAIRYNSTYRVSIASSASDLSGVTMAENFTLSFSTGGVGVVSTFPADGDRSATVNQGFFPVQIVFNGDIDPRTLNKNTVQIRPDHRTDYRVDTFRDPTTGLTTARIAMTYQFETDYRVTVTRRVRTATGQPLTNTPYTFSFRTAAPVPLPYVDTQTR